MQSAATKNDTGKSASSLNTKWAALRHWLTGASGRLRGARRADAGSAAAAGPVSAEHANLLQLDAERARIYRDLHDDIGARLISIMHVSQDAEVQGLARRALQELREVVYHTRGEPGNLTLVLADIRHELVERLASAEWTLNWEQGVLPDILLPGHRAIHLYRIVREAASNAIKHARPGELRVRIRHEADMVYLDVSNQGKAYSGSSASTGSGVRNMQHRADRLGGALTLEPATLQGTKVVLRFPLLES